jgi:metal-dependent amidase/aminoacylase/carboxypeptidase family protein
MRGLKQHGRNRTMHIINRIAAFHDDMTAWRRDIHAHPETAFEERRTAAVIADKLRGFGLEVHEGLAKTSAGRFLHNPRYDFNDAILPLGASYWARLVEAELPRKG